jgi:hypothetical protein
MAKKGKMCAEFQNDLIMLFYDELGAAEKKALQAHLVECSACRQEQEKWSTIFQSTVPAALDKEWLVQNRQALFFRLRGRALPAIKRRRQAVAWAFQLGLAAALLVFSFLLGRNERPSRGSVNDMNDLFTAGRAVSTETGTISPFLLGIEKITAKPDGAVEIRYQTMNNMRIQGRPSDPEVQHILRYAMQNEDAAVRLHAVKAAQLLTETPDQVEATTVDAMETILENEANVGIRLAVIKTFAAFSSTPRIQDVLFKTMLHDSSEAVRIQAFKSLTEHEASGELEHYLNTAQSDSNMYIRLKSLDLLKRKEQL